MTFKEYMLLHLQVYCVLVTLIFAASLIVGLIFSPEENLKYYHLIGPFITAALCTLTTFITYFKNEPSLTQYIIRNVLQLAVIEAIVLIMIKPPTDANHMLFYTIIGLIVLIIFALTKLAIWLKKYVQSNKLTEQLRKLQASEE